MNNELVANPYTSERPSVPAAPSVAANTDAQRAIAEVQAAMVIARQNPRDPVAAVDRIINACTRKGLAESAIYLYEKGGTEISGASIRLAEAMAQQWGNIQYGLREIGNANGVSTMQAYAWDVETNTRREITFQVPHIRSTRRGSYKLEDPREIYELTANQGARRLRSCILGVIPGDVQEAAVAQCELTLSAHADVTPESVKKMVDAFAAFGVTQEQIEKRIQRHLDAIRPAQIIGLKKIYASLRDGMSGPADWFEMPQAEPAAARTVESAKERARILREAKAAKAAAAEQNENAEGGGGADDGNA